MSHWVRLAEAGEATGAITNHVNDLADETSTQAAPSMLRAPLRHVVDFDNLWVEALRNPQDVTGAGRLIHVTATAAARPLSPLEVIGTLGNFSDLEIARLLSTTRQSVHNWRKGSSEPRPRTLQKLNELVSLLKELSAVVTYDKIRLRHSLLCGFRGSRPTPADLIAANDMGGARRLLGLEAPSPTEPEIESEFVQLADLD